MSSGGISYSGITNYGVVTLPATGGWNTNNNILRDPSKSITTRRIDKVGDNNNLISDLTALENVSIANVCKTNNKKKLPQIDRAMNKFEYLNDEVFDTFYEAVVQSTEESILNAMLAAKDMVSIKPKGKLISSLKPQDLK